MDLDTHKKPQNSFFVVVPYTSALAGLNVLTKLQLSYVIEKKRILAFFPPAEKAFVFQPSSFSQKTSIGTRKK